MIDIIHLLRILTAIPASPEAISGIIRKQAYLRRGRSFRIESFKTYLPLFFKSGEGYVASGFTPGGGYIGVWCRDSAYLITELIQQGRVDRAAQQILWVWEHQVRPGSRGIYGRGAQTLMYRAKKIGPIEAERFSGALPTSIHRGYCEVYGGSPDIDSTALQISAAARILLHRKSENLFEQIKSKVTDAIRYLESRDSDEDLLLEQGANEDWMDVMLRSGKTVYSQAVWIEALESWSRVLAEYGRGSESDRLYAVAKETRRAVETVLWSGEFYTDKLDSGGKQTHLTQDVIYYLQLLPSRVGRVAQTLDAIKKRLWRPLGPASIDPPSQNTAPLKLKPMRYQNAAFWPWITAKEISVRWRAEDKESAEKLILQVLPYASLEWLEPTRGSHSGRYPFRTGLAAVLSALRPLRFSDTLSL